MVAGKGRCTSCVTGKETIMNKITKWMNDNRTLAIDLYTGEINCTSLAEMAYNEFEELDLDTACDIAFEISEKYKEE